MAIVPGSGSFRPFRWPRATGCIRQAWRVAALLLLSAGAQAAVHCAPADASGARHCTASVRGDIVRTMEATQERSNWCWAAVISMVLRRHGVAAPQREIVMRSIGSAVDRRLQARDLPGVFESEWRARDGRGGTARAIALPARLHLSDSRIADTIVDALTADQPMIMGMRGHAVVLVGVMYLELPSGGRQVLGGLVLDPLPLQGLRLVQENEMRPVLLAQVEVGRAR